MADNRCMRWLVTGLSSLLAPRLCPGCDQPVQELVGCGRSSFCQACALLLEPCHRCHQPPAKSAALYQYGGPLAEGLRRFKYRARSDLGRPLAELLIASAAVYRDRVDAIVPVPLHPRDLRERGFNQAVTLAAPLARRLGVPMLVDQLHRIRHTAGQATLPRADRAANVNGAFAYRGALVGRTALLVDDVRTTGATLAAAGEALLQGGYAHVMSLALARADSG
ncbi:MAG: ComF family protein [Proteobacteria bacterium]|nr:ComF family protein [Pseudomonadota bacterium]